MACMHPIRKVSVDQIPSPAYLATYFVDIPTVSSITDWKSTWSSSSTAVAGGQANENAPEHGSNSTVVIISILWKK
ncbi:hypothetical protein Hypma_004601 [Hypsizygus marmoreus]|uniref:Uncharacterized protein n=1 Tax=Hypsizygus marmoreus TaxID=39966 RepID=A0A369JZF5_HYPMA|nr:hypothetical protein Hypma_004601 [Hypsizygus marmoreus]